MLGAEEEGGGSMLSGWGHGNRMKQQAGDFSCPCSPTRDERQHNEQKTHTHRRRGIERETERPYSDI